VDITSSKVSVALATDGSAIPAAFEGPGVDVVEFNVGATGVPVGVVTTGSKLRILMRSSIHLNSAPETPSSTLNRSSMASLVIVSITAN